MSNYNTFSKCIVKSVNHIFKNFLSDSSIQEVYENQSRDTDPKVSIEIDGNLTGEIIINIPEQTLSLITKHFVPDENNKSLKKHYRDIAGELANMITGTFANQLQFIDFKLRLSAPEYNDDPILLKTFYENINISFTSHFGGFDVDLFYKED